MLLFLLEQLGRLPGAFTVRRTALHGGDWKVDLVIEDEAGEQLWTRLGPWECIACPAGVIHGFENKSLEPVYFQVMLGRGKPEAMGYADDKLFERRDAHLKEV